MIETTTKHTFIDEMIKHGFSYDGARALFAYYEDEMIDMYNWIKPEISVPVHGEHRHAGISLTFNPIAFRCEWVEYKNIEELNKDYSHDYDFDDLCGDTQVIKVGEEGLIIQQF